MFAGFWGQILDVLFWNHIVQFGSDLCTDEDFVKDDEELRFKIFVNFEWWEVLFNELTHNLDEMDHDELEKELFFPFSMIELLLISCF